MACEKIFENLKQRKLTKIGMISGTDGFSRQGRQSWQVAIPLPYIRLVQLTLC